MNLSSICAILISVITCDYTMFSLVDGLLIEVFSLLN